MDSLRGLRFVFHNPSRLASTPDHNGAFIERVTASSSSSSFSPRMLEHMFSESKIELSQRRAPPPVDRRPSSKPCAARPRVLRVSPILFFRGGGVWRFA